MAGLRSSSVTHTKNQEAKLRTFPTLNAPRWRNTRTCTYALFVRSFSLVIERENHGWNEAAYLMLTMSVILRALSQSDIPLVSFGITYCKVLNSKTNLGENAAQIWWLNDAKVC